MFSPYFYLCLSSALQPSSRECETIKNSGYSTAELRKDIEEMENEKEIVQKRIERMQRKVGGFEQELTWRQVEGMPNLAVMLEVGRKLRLEKEREKEILGQKVPPLLAVLYLKLKPNAPLARRTSGPASATRASAPSASSTSWPTSGRPASAPPPRASSPSSRRRSRSTTTSSRRSCQRSLS